MAWLIAFAILAVAVLFATGYRKSSLALALAALIAGVSIYFYNEGQEQHETTRIAISEIALEQVELRPTFRSGYDLTGTIRNNSEKYRLDGIDVAVTLRDCTSADASHCTVLGQASGYAAMTVPPQESGSFVVALHFGGDRPKVKGRFAWDYEITAIRAKRQ